MLNTANPTPRPIIIRIGSQGGIVMHRGVSPLELSYALVNFFSIVQPRMLSQSFGMGIAWFSPFPPVRTGIADCSAELVEALRGRGYDIDLYAVSAAHDFPWTHRRRPYDLIVYQFGNSSHHDYQWAYALRYPGLVVLHDTHLHHARAAFLLRERRAADYRAEFAWNHPDVPSDAAELGVAGFDSQLYYEWPMTRALIESSRLTAAHVNAQLLNAQFPKNSQGPIPNTQLVSIRLGHGELVTEERRNRARLEIRTKYGIAHD